MNRYSVISPITSPRRFPFDGTLRTAWTEEEITEAEENLLDIQTLEGFAEASVNGTRFKIVDRPSIEQRYLTNLLEGRCWAADFWNQLHSQRERVQENIRKQEEELRLLSVHLDIIDDARKQREAL